MAERQELLRLLPRVDEVLAHSAMPRNAPRGQALRAARAAVAHARDRILRGESDVPPDLDSVARDAAQRLEQFLTRRVRRVVNATGVVLSTGLGRAPLSEAAQQALADVAAYCSLEVDLASGERIERDEHVRGLLEEITGAPSALVVNNNAAATVLVLNTLAAGREVIVSRGELVEIGGAFRIPDILRLSGCTLVEVGCTNRTHLRDYERAITPRTGLLLSVHQSNYRITGFAKQTETAALARLAQERGIPCVHDLGSGALTDLRAYGLPHEPSAPESLAAGVDAVLFSGDKLLGGPQCGIILGKKDPLRAMRSNPFYRAFRVDKLIYAALEATLRLFLDPDSLPARHRALGLMARSVDDLRAQAESLAGDVQRACGAWLDVHTLDDESEVGGGSLAGHTLPTVVVALRPRGLSVDALARRLRLRPVPVFTRIRGESVLLDPRTLLSGDAAAVLDALRAIGTALGDGVA